MSLRLLLVEFSSNEKARMRDTEVPAVKIVEQSGEGGMWLYAASLAESLTLAGMSVELITSATAPDDPLSGTPQRKELHWSGVGGKKALVDYVRNEASLAREARRSSDLWIINSQLTGLIRPPIAFDVVHDPEGRTVRKSAPLSKLRRSMRDFSGNSQVSHGPNFCPKPPTWPLPPYCTISQAGKSDSNTPLWEPNSHDFVALVYGRSSRGAAAATIKDWIDALTPKQRNRITLAITGTETISQVRSINLPPRLTDGELHWAHRHASCVLIPHNSNPRSASGILGLATAYTVPAVVSSVVDASLQFQPPDIAGIGTDGLVRLLDREEDSFIANHAPGLRAAKSAFGLELRELLTQAANVY